MANTNGSGTAQARPRPETKNQRANRQDSAYPAACGASYSTAFALSAHTACCGICPAVQG